MVKNIVIALLVGIIIGQTCKADTAVNINSITRKDLFAAAALCGIIANEKSNPLGFKLFNDVRNEWRSKNQFVAGANYYADKMDELDSTASPSKP
jgi:hypothetical protein